MSKTLLQQGALALPYVSLVLAIPQLLSAKQLAEVLYMPFVHIDPKRSCCYITCDQSMVTASCMSLTLWHMQVLMDPLHCKSALRAS